MRRSKVRRDATRRQPSRIEWSRVRETTRDAARRTLAAHLCQAASRALTTFALSRRTLTRVDRRLSTRHRSLQLGDTNEDPRSRRTYFSPLRAHGKSQLDPIFASIFFSLYPRSPPVLLGTNLDVPPTAPFSPSVFPPRLVSSRSRDQRNPTKRKVGWKGEGVSR